MPAPPSGPASPSSAQNLRLVRKLRLSHLQIIDGILQNGSFALAAQQLGMTQSAVTKAVQEIEGFLDARLFHRSNRGVTPTELGLQLERHIRVILSEVRFMGESVQALAQGDAGHVVVGVLTTASSSAFSEAIRLLHQRHPRVRITVLVGDRNQLHGYLADGRVDLVFGGMPGAGAPWMDRLQAHALYDESLVVMAGREHPLAGKTAVGLADLTVHPWVLPPAESLVRQRLDQVFAQARLKVPADCIESFSPLLNIGLLSDQRTLTFMSAGLAQVLQGAGALVRIAVELPARFGAIGYVIRAEREPSFACRSLIACLQEKVAGEAIGASETR